MHLRLAPSADQTVLLPTLHSTPLRLLRKPRSRFHILLQLFGEFSLLRGETEEKPLRRLFRLSELLSHVNHSGGHRLQNQLHRERSSAHQKLRQELLPRLLLLQMDLQRRENSRPSDRHQQQLAGAREPVRGPDKRVARVLQNNHVTRTAGEGE